FFFSSRRRHTRFSRDWSSDVCSSDLTPSTARTAGCSPRLNSEARNPDWSGKYFFTPRTSTSGGPASMRWVGVATCSSLLSGTDGHLLRMRMMEPTRHPGVLGGAFGRRERRVVDRADLLHHVGAAGVEPAARWRRAQVGR